MDVGYIALILVKDIFLSYLDDLRAICSVLSPYLFTGSILVLLIHHIYRRRMSYAVLSLTYIHKRSRSLHNAVLSIILPPHFITLR